MAILCARRYQLWYVILRRSSEITASFLLDYNAPLTENGAYTEKYDEAAEMIAVYDTLSDYLIKPERPQYIPPVAYASVAITEMLTYHQILDQVVRSYPAGKSS